MMKRATSAPACCLIATCATPIARGVLSPWRRRTATSAPMAPLNAPQVRHPDEPVLVSAHKHPGQSHYAPPVGLEPTTRCLEGSCSIHLSYGGLAQGQR